GVPIEARTLLLEQRRDPDEDARGTEAALQRTGGGECRRQRVALFFREALQCRDARAGDLVHRQIAADDRFAVDEHRAAAALSRRRAAVLGRDDVQLLPQGGEQVWVGAGDADLVAVQ